MEMTWRNTIWFCCTRRWLCMVPISISFRDYNLLCLVVVYLLHRMIKPDICITYMFFFCRIIKYHLMIGWIVKNNTKFGPSSTINPMFILLQNNLKFDCFLPLLGSLRWWFSQQIKNYGAHIIKKILLLKMAIPQLIQLNKKQKQSEEIYICKLFDLCLFIFKALSNRVGHHYHLLQHYASTALHSYLSLVCNNSRWPSCIIVRRHNQHYL